MLDSLETRRDHLTLAEFEIVSLKCAGLDSKTAVEGRRWVECMTPTRDHEDGPDFWRWIEEHHLTDAGSLLYDTFFLVERATGAVVAIASIVFDDRGAGAVNGIDGAWVGGVNVRAEYRGRGLGKILMSVLHEHIQNFSDRTGRQVPVNLFTSAELARSFYGPRYALLRPIVVPQFGMRYCYRRVFCPEIPPEAAGHDD